MQNLTSFFTSLHKIKSIVHAIKQAGGTAYLVGGSVRDLVLERPLKDFDIEVHGLLIEKLQELLQAFGAVALVGKKFGVLRVGGFDIDWSIPRKDSTGRKPEVTLDPAMTIEQAARRRDVTMNAMALDLHDVREGASFNIIDPYGGLDDIKHKRLRAVDQKLFLEDPLRFYRVMQFIGRFEMQPDQGLNELCRTMSLSDIPDSQDQASGAIDDLLPKPLARERIFEEIKKLLLLSQSPSLGFRWLAKIGRLKETFPELHILIGVAQRSDYHPEGDAFEHTMQAIDASARFDNYFVDATLQWGVASSGLPEKFIIMLAVLCHDLGKATKTDAQLHSYGHAEEGLLISKPFLKRFTHDHFLIAAVGKLVLHHMAPFSFLAGRASLKAYKRLAIKLAPETSLRQLGLVALADYQGRNGQGHEPLTVHKDLLQGFLQQAEKAKVMHYPEPPILQGRDLLGIIAPGPEIGKILKKAYEIQIEDGITDPEELKRRVL